MRNTCWNRVVKSVASSGERRARDVRNGAMPVVSIRYLQKGLSSGGMD
jgi:hypothetical protein